MISGNYQEIPNSELADAAAQLEGAWRHPGLPRQQYAIVKDELRRFAQGERIAPFDALVECWRPMIYRDNASVLDVGAAFGYYREVLRLTDALVDYTGLDYSEAFVEFGRSLFPGIRLHVGDALNLPFETESFDIVLHGACIMHLLDHERAVREAVRVTRRYVIFSRTPVFDKLPTTFYQKEAYGVQCMEARYNERELLGLFRKNGLNLLHSATVFWCEEEGYGHRTYLLEKNIPEPYASCSSI